jgi:hypothetical protein
MKKIAESEGAIRETQMPALLSYPPPIIVDR